MVGRSLRPGYRADLNFLSQRDYTRSSARYIRLRIGAIVGFATAQYHCGRRLSKEIHGERLPRNEYRRDGLAGGEGTRLYPLTADEAKPALPFASGYRLVDFVLSNLVNSRISTIYVLAQYKPESLIKHVATAWSPWFADGEGTIKVLLPRSNTLGGQFKGTADAVYQYLDLLQAHSPDVVAVFAADHVYRMDVRQMVASHRERKADVTVAAVAVPLKQASSFGILATAPDGRVREFREKPRHAAPLPSDPTRAYASMGNYLFDPQSLKALHEARRAGRDRFRPRHPAAPMLEPPGLRLRFRQNRVPGVQDHEEPPTGATSAPWPRSPPRSRTLWRIRRASTSGTAAGRSAAKEMPGAALAPAAQVARALASRE